MGNPPIGSSDAPDAEGGRLRRLLRALVTLPVLAVRGPWRLLRWVAVAPPRAVGRGLRAARRQPSIATALGIIVLQAGAALAIVDLTRPPPEVVNDTVEADEETEDPDPQRRSGNGHEMVRGIELEGGLTVFEVEHDGGGNLIVRLADEDGERVAGLVNVIGSFDGSTAMHVERGTYALDVQANGRWSIAVLQPRVLDPAALPVSLRGEGPVATGAFEANSGPVRFRLVHQGEQNFHVRLLDRDGRRVASIVNEIGPLDTTVDLELEPAVYLFDINADGPWAMTVRPGESPTDPPRRDPPSSRDDFPRGL